MILVIKIKEFVSYLLEKTLDFISGQNEFSSYGFKEITPNRVSSRLGIKDVYGNREFTDKKGVRIYRRNTKENLPDISLIIEEFTPGYRVELDSLPFMDEYHFHTPSLVPKDEVFRILENYLKPTNEG